MIITYIGRSRTISLDGYLQHVAKELPTYRVDLWELMAQLDLLLKYYESNELYELCAKIHIIQKEIENKQVK